MSHARSEYATFRVQAPDIHEALLSLGKLATKSGLDKELIELIKIRASQINGCASSDCPPTRSIWSRSGAKRRNSPCASAPHWPGRKR